MSKSNNSRRKFLSLSLLGGAALAAGKADAQQLVKPTEKVKMLTPDGRMVEVDKAVLDQATNRQKASNKEVLKWASPAKKI